MTPKRSQSQPIATYNTVVVVGAGPVGSFLSSLLTQYGFEVQLYELRQDCRLNTKTKRISINIAWSERGKAALRRVNAEESVLAISKPMFARKIHPLCPSGSSDSTYDIPYGKDYQLISSVSRTDINNVLLDTYEKRSGKKVFFLHKLLFVDHQKNECVFENLENVDSDSDDSEKKVFVRVKFGFLFGTDGANSVVRHQILKHPSTSVDFSLTHIKHQYKELLLPTKSNGEPMLEMGFLHIWPRGDSMLIGLPNKDNTFTMTFFAPAETFESISQGNDCEKASRIRTYFRIYFESFAELLGYEELVSQFIANSNPPLAYVKVSPWFNNNSCLLGDAAHAIVPFYGQGMNCGFEDCAVLDDIIRMKLTGQPTNTCGDTLRMAENVSDALVKLSLTDETKLSLLVEAASQFSSLRKPDTDGILQLSLENYIEMRKSVLSPAFRLRKHIDNTLQWLMPSSWIPQYSMVAFSTIPYSEVIRRRDKQRCIVSTLINSVAFCVVSTLCVTSFVLISKLRKRL